MSSRCGTSRGRNLSAGETSRIGPNPGGAGDGKGDGITAGAGCTIGRYFYFDLARPLCDCVRYFSRDRLEPPFLIYSFAI